MNIVTRNDILNIFSISIIINLKNYVGEIALKKVLYFLLISMLFLTACGNKYYEEIRESFGKDTESIMNLVLEAVEEERDFTDSEIEKIDKYNKQYLNNLASTDESHVYLHTGILIDEHSTSLLHDEKEEVKELAKEIQVSLEEGYEGYEEYVDKKLAKEKKKKDALRREGIDVEFAQDALEIANEVDYYFNELEFLYAELPDDIYNLINDFDSSYYLGYGEEFSKEEEEIYNAVKLLEGRYYIYDIDAEKGTRDSSEEINKYIEQIRDLTSDIR